MYACLDESELWILGGLDCADACLALGKGVNC